ncbi:MAG: hypothetical protein ACOC8E_01185 [Planctomycetota bacterium]
MAVLCALVLSGAVGRGDTLVLKDGGRLTGEVGVLTVKLADGEKELSRGEFIGLSLGETDTVRLKGEKSVDGRLVAVQVELGGERRRLTREELASVEIDYDPLAGARREFRIRRAGLDETDPAAICELARWCQEQGLTAEMRAMATQCIRAGPSSGAAVLAHRLLGHEIRDGKWVDPRRPPLPEEPDVEVEPEPKVDAESLAAYREVVKLYVQKVAEVKSTERDAVEDFYRPDLQKLFDRTSALKKEYEKKKGRLDEVRDDIRHEKSHEDYDASPDNADERRQKDRVDRLRRKRDRLKRELTALGDDYKETLHKRNVMAAKVKILLNRAGERYETRKRNLASISSEIERRIYDQHAKMPRDDIVGLYEKIFEQTPIGDPLLQKEKQKAKKGEKKGE